MDCPIDGTALAMTDRSGVEIDYCPTCRGVWLDRGELDKIIERFDGTGSPRDTDEDARGTSHGGSEHGRDKGKGKKRRGSMLSELFELGG
jgi:hypothetical protein